MDQRFLSSRRWPILAALTASLMLIPVVASAQEGGEGAPPATEAPATTQAPQPDPTEAPPTTQAPAPTETTSAPPTTAAPSQPAPTTAPTPTTLSPAQIAEKEKAVANFSYAQAADQEVANRLRAITEEANSTVEKIEAARAAMAESEKTKELTRDLLASSGKRRTQIEARLRVQAVEGYKTRSTEGTTLLFASLPVNRSLRQDQLLESASSSTAELLSELQRLVEDREIAQAEAEWAAIEAERAEASLKIELEKHQAQLDDQRELKLEAERRIGVWSRQLSLYAAEDAGIQELIGERAERVNTGINSPTAPSTVGYQWPISPPRVTSEYGYRVHPVYGTRKLHRGTDLGAPGGTPIAAANDGVVIGVRSMQGYGNTVIVDHGGGVTTLYAHMSQYNVSVDQVVDRGDIVGFVGMTGTATGNHLHFEVRVNGGAVNARSYMPGG